MTSGCGGGIALLAIFATSDESDGSKDLPATVADVVVSAPETWDRCVVEFCLRNDDAGTLAARIEYEVVGGVAPRRGRRLATPLPGSTPLEPIAPDKTVQFLWDAKTDLEDQFGWVELTITPTEDGVEGEPYHSPEAVRAGNTPAEVGAVAVLHQEDMIVVVFEIADGESDLVELTELEVAVGGSGCDGSFQAVPDFVFDGLTQEYTTAPPPGRRSFLGFPLAGLDDPAVAPEIRRATRRGFFGELCVQLWLRDGDEEPSPACGCGTVDLNEPPDVELLQFSREELAGGVLPLRFRVFDDDKIERDGPEVQPANVEVLVQSEGGELRPAYEFPSEASSGRNAVVTLPGSSRGELHLPVNVFLWDAATQLGGVGRAGVIVKLRAFDGVEDGSQETRAVAFESAPALVKLSGDFAAGSAPYACTSADYDGDGYADVVVSNRGSEFATVLRGGPGGLTVGQPVQVPQHMILCASGDFNGDGFFDAVLVEDRGTTVTELHGGPAGLSRGQVHPVSGQVHQVTVADFDGDEYDDAIVGPHPYPTSIKENVRSIFLFQGGPAGLSYRDRVGFPGLPRDTCAVDLNGDGTDEILVSVTLGTSGELYLLEIEDGGGISKLLLRNDLQDPGKLAAGDFNGDGLLDVAVMEYAIRRVKVFSGCDEAQWLCNPYASPVGQGPRAAAPADFDRDGWIDLAVLNVTSKNVTFLAGIAGGRLQTMYDLPAGESSDRHIAWAEVTGDGFPDVLVPNDREDTVTLLTGSTTGLQEGGTVYTGQAPESVLADDFDGDGLAEVVVPNRTSNRVSYLGADRSVFALDDGEILAERRAVTIAAGDFDCDGERDLVVAYVGAAGLSVVHGVASSAGRLPVRIDSGSPIAVAVGDFTGDRCDDLVTLDQERQAVVLLPGGPEGISPVGTILPAAVAGSVAISADFNRDGVLDLVVAERGTDTVRFFAGGDSSDGLRLEGQPIPVGDSPAALASGDFDLDGDLDVFVVNSRSNDISVLRGSAEGFHLPEIRVTEGTRQNPQEVVTGDFDGDGFPGAVVRNEGSEDLSFYRGSREGLVWQREIELEEPANGIAAGDFDGDAFPDVVIFTTGLDRVHLLRGGPHGLRPPQGFDCGEAPRAMVAGEFDGDGYLDLVVGNQLQRVTLLRGDPEGFRPFHERFDVHDLPAGFSPDILLSDDVTRDGFADIVVASRGVAGLHLLRHRGRVPRVNRLVDADGAPASVTSAHCRLELPPHALKEPTQVCLLLTPVFPLPRREYAEKGRYLTPVTQAVSILAEDTPIEGDTPARLTLRLHQRGQELVGLLEDEGPAIVENLRVIRKDEKGLGVEFKRLSSEEGRVEIELADMDNDGKLDACAFPIRQFGSYVVALERPATELHERPTPSPRYRPRDEVQRPRPGETAE